MRAGDAPDAENLDNLPQGYYYRLAEVNTSEWVDRHIKVLSKPRLRRVMSDLELLHLLTNARYKAADGDASMQEVVQYADEIITANRRKKWQQSCCTGIISCCVS